MEGVAQEEWGAAMDRFYFPLDDGGEGNER